MIDMKGFAEFHVSTWPPWDRTAIKFMINSFLELASKTTVSFVFALSNIRSVTFSSVMRIWSPKYKTKLQSQVFGSVMFLECILAWSRLFQILMSSKQIHVQQIFQIHNFIKKQGEQ